MDTIFTFKAPGEMIARLNALAQQMERPKSYLVRKALERFLEEEEDIQISLQRLSDDKPSKRISLQQLKRKYGMED